MDNIVLGVQEMSDAMKELKNISLFILTASLLWILTSDAVVGTLRTRADVQSFASWVVVKDAIEEAYALAAQTGRTFEDVAVGETLSEYSEVLPVQSGTEVESVPIPLIAEAPWKIGAVEPFSLRRVPAAAAAYVFDILPSTGEIVPSGFILLLLSGKAYVVEKDRLVVRDLREIHQQVLVGRINGPVGLPAVVNLMRTRGETIEDASTLRPTDKIVAQLLSEVTEQRYTVASLPFAPGLFPSAVLTFLGLAAFGMAGPVLRIWSFKPTADKEETWIMALSLPGPAGAVLRLLQLLVIAFCVALPLYVLWDQTRLIALLAPMERTLWWAVALGPLFAAAAMAAAGASLSHSAWRWSLKFPAGPRKASATRT